MYCSDCLFRERERGIRRGRDERCGGNGNMAVYKSCLLYTVLFTGKVAIEVGTASSGHLFSHGAAVVYSQQAQPSPAQPARFQLL